MKTRLPCILLATLSICLSSCLFQEPVFTEGFVKPDPGLAGVWVTEDETGDPRGREFAVLTPAGTESFMLHYPAGAGAGSYFEVRPLKIAEKNIWQVRLVLTFEDGLPKTGTPVYTLLLVEQASDGGLSVRSLKNEGDHTTSAAATKKALEEKAPNWDALFGEAKIFTRLKDR